MAYSIGVWEYAASVNYTLVVSPLAYQYAAQPVGLNVGLVMDVSPLAYRYAAQAVGLTFSTPSTGDTHDGFLRRSRRERRLDALRARRDDERLADAQALRAALERALDGAEDIPAPKVVQAVEAAPKPAEVDWARIAERDEDYARLSRMVTRLTAMVEAEAKRRADDDDDDEEAMFLMGAA